MNGRFYLKDLSGHSYDNSSIAGSFTLTFLHVSPLFSYLLLAQTQQKDREGEGRVKEELWIAGCGSKEFMNSTTSHNRLLPLVSLLFPTFPGLLKSLRKSKGKKRRPTKGNTMAVPRELVISSKASFSSPRLWSLYSILWNTLSLLLFYYPHASRFRPSLGLDTLSLYFVLRGKIERCPGQA